MHWWRRRELFSARKLNIKSVLDKSHSLKRAVGVPTFLHHFSTIC